MHPFALPQRAAASSVTPQVARSEAERLIKGHKNTVFQWSTTTLSCTAKNLYECGIKNKWSKYCENRRGNGTSFGKKVQSWHHRHYAVIGMTSLTLKPLCTHWVGPGRGGGGGWGWGGLSTPPPKGWPAVRCLFHAQRLWSWTACYCSCRCPVQAPQPPNYMRGPGDGRREPETPRCSHVIFLRSNLCRVFCENNCDASIRGCPRRSWRPSDFFLTYEVI